MTDDERDDHEDRRRGRHGKRVKALPDKSTPDPADPGLVGWILDLFRGSERADSLVVTKLWGRGGQERDGVPTKKYQFALDKRPTREECVAISNELIEAMQNESNATGISLLFEVTAHNHKKGPGAFESRRLRFAPVLSLSTAGRRLGIPGDSDDYDGLPSTEEIYRKRHVDGFEDARYATDTALNSLGGLVHVLVKLNEDNSKKINQVLDANISLMKANVDLRRSEMDDKIRWSNHEFGMKLRERGLNLVAGLLPGVVEKMTNHKLPGGRTAASLTIESVVDSLSDDEKVLVLGRWSDAGQCTTAGILTESQVRILGGVQNGEAEDLLDQLLEGQANAVTGDQVKAIAARVDMNKLLPLLGLVQERKEKLTARNNGATPQNGAK